MMEKKRYSNSGIRMPLRGHNCQKWKSRFLTCPCHMIYRVEANGLSISNYIFKIAIFVSLWNLGSFRQKLIFRIRIRINLFTIKKYIGKTRNMVGHLRGAQLVKCRRPLHILSITAQLNIKSKKSFAHVTHILIVFICRTPHFVST